MPHETNEKKNNDELQNLTIPKLFKKQALKYGSSRVAMREKEYGIWRSFTWYEYLKKVKYIALGLNHLGLNKNDKVAFIGHNRPEGLWSEMGCLCAGGICSWLFQDSLIEEVKYIIDHSDSKYVFCEGQEEVDKILSIKSEVPKVRRIIWDDRKGMRSYNQEILMSLEDLILLGRSIDKNNSKKFNDLCNKITDKDVALLLYTSGTSSLPKGVLLSHYNVLSMGNNLLKVDPCDEKDNYVSYLPFAWIGEQMMAISCGLQVGFTINFPEKPETLSENIREIAPQVMFAPPRLYEQMTREIQVKHLDSTWIKRKFYRIATWIGYKVADYKFNKKVIPIYLKIIYWLARITVLNKIKDHLGLSGIRNAYTGGAAMGPDHFKFFHSLDVNLKQIYGQTEVSGIAVVHRNGDIKFDTVGKPIPGTTIKITEEGEIITQSTGMFMGYYKNQRATEKAFKDGWLHSDDKGFIDEDGHITVFDRSKDVFTLRDGRPFAPQYLETRLKFSPYIKDSWVVGDNQPYVAAVICIDYSVVGKWADENKIPYTNYSELSQNEEVYNLIEKQIRTANKDLPSVAKVNKFTNLYKELDPDDDELTRTRKLKRGTVEKRYNKIVNALYSNGNSGKINTVIKYEDGREANINATFHIRTV